MKYMAEGMKYLPNNLQNFILNLNKNKLGRNAENWKYLVEGIKYLPNSLKNFDLYLNLNNLGGN